MNNLNDIKRKVPITKILSHYGCKDNGRNQNWGCNRHESKNKTSISISNNQVCCCVSPSCDLKGDIFSVISLYEGMDLKHDFKKILNKACEIGGIDYKYEKIDPGDIERLIKQDIIKEANKIFFKETKRHIYEIEEYIKEKRNITDTDLSKLNLGFLPKEKYLDIKRIIIEKLPQTKDIYYFDEETNQKKYLINSYYAFVNRIIHPHFYNKDILYITGEMTPISLKNARSGPKYIKMNANFAVYENGEGYILDSLNTQNKDSIIISEGYWDALKLHLLGFNTITFGTCKISQYFIEQYSHKLRNFKKIITCFDTESNKSGIYGAIAFNKKLFELDIKNIYISELPEKNGNKIDIDAFITTISKGNKENIEEYVIDKASKFYNYLLDIIKESDDTDKDDLTMELLEVFDKFPIRDKIGIERELKKIFKFDNRELNKYIKETIKNTKDEKKSEESTTTLSNNEEDSDSLYISNGLKLWEENPYFFDRNKIFWAWDKNISKWKITDETDLLNLLDNLVKIEEDTSVNNIKINHLNAFKKIGRIKHPKDPPKEWIQFKDKIYDIESKRIFDTTPEYFFLNPIPFTIGKIPDTPYMDKLFTEWVGAEYKDLLYEIIAYCLYRDMPIQSLFCFVGSGANGKSKYLNLVRKYLGTENTTSSNFNLLTGGSNSKFETSKMYRKLACFVSETDYMEQKETTQIKTMTGGDIMTYEYKGKNPFSEFNYTKLLIATNSIPPSKDQTKGFYRRWEIVNFPYTFSGNTDVLKQIPDIEYENLSLKLLDVLKNLLKRGHFISDVSVEDKKTMYIKYSDPIIPFIKERCIEDQEYSIPFFQLYDIFTIYLEETGKRILSKKEFSAKIKEHGFEIQRIGKILKDGKRTVWYYVVGLDIKKINNIIKEELNLITLEDFKIEENKFITINV